MGSGNVGKAEKVSLRSRDRTNAQKKRGRHRRVVGGAGRAGSKPRQTYPWEQTAVITSSASARWTSREDDESSRARRRRPGAPSRIFEARSKPGRFCVDDPSGRSPAEPGPAGACSDRFRPAHSALKIPRLSGVIKKVALARCDADPRATTTISAQHFERPAKVSCAFAPPAHGGVGTRALLKTSQATRPPTPTPRLSRELHLG